MVTRSRSRGPGAGPLGGGAKAAPLRRGEAAAGSAAPGSEPGERGGGRGLQGAGVQGRPHVRAWLPPCALFLGRRGRPRDRDQVLPFPPPSYRTGSLPRDTPLVPGSLWADQTRPRSRFPLRETRCRRKSSPPASGSLPEGVVFVVFILLGDKDLGTGGAGAGEARPTGPCDEPCRAAGGGSQAPRELQSSPDRETHSDTSTGEALGRGEGGDSASWAGRDCDAAAEFGVRLQ